MIKSFCTLAYPINGLTLYMVQ